MLDRNCSKAATSRFWAQFSTRFSQAASGTIFFLADGNQRPAYNLFSFFGCYELINLNTSVVKRLVALNVHTENGMPNFLILTVYYIKFYLENLVVWGWGEGRGG